MALRFAIRMNKKFPARIEVLKDIFEDGKSGQKSLGTLKGFDKEAIAQFSNDNQLTDEDCFQLENYAANLVFNQKEFKAQPEELNKASIYFAPAYEAALIDLWRHAKKHNIDFCPFEIHHAALLHKAKAVERKINEITGKSVNILEGLGVDTRHYDDAIYQQCKSSQKFFKLLLKLDVPTEKLCEEFIQIAKNDYDKTPNMKPHYFKEYAATIRRLPGWYNTIVIDILLRHGLNPIETIPAAKVAEYWVAPRKARFQLSEAFKVFKDTFNPKKEEEASIEKSLKAQYGRGVSTA